MQKKIELLKDVGLTHSASLEATLPNKSDESQLVKPFIKKTAGNESSTAKKGLKRQKYLIETLLALAILLGGGLSYNRKGQLLKDEKSPKFLLANQIKEI